MLILLLVLYNYFLCYLLYRVILFWFSSSLLVRGKFRSTINLHHQWLLGHLRFICHFCYKNIECAIYLSKSWTVRMINMLRHITVQSSTNKSPFISFVGKNKSQRSFWTSSIHQNYLSWKKNLVINISRVHVCWSQLFRRDVPSDQHSNCTPFCQAGAIGALAPCHSKHSWCCPGFS